MALNLGTLAVKVALDITVDGCEHTTTDDREAIVGYLRKETDPHLVLSVRVLDHTSEPRVSRQTYADRDVRVIPAGPSWEAQSAVNADIVVNGLRGLTLTDEDGERIIEAVRARVR